MATNSEVWEGAGVIGGYDTVALAPLIALTVISLPSRLQPPATCLSH